MIGIFLEVSNFNRLFIELNRFFPDIYRIEEHVYSDGLDKLQVRSINAPLDSWSWVNIHTQLISSPTSVSKAQGEKKNSRYASSMVWRVEKTIVA
jgi:hypothetical protein